MVEVAEQRGGEPDLVAVVQSGDVAFRRRNAAAADRTIVFKGVKRQPSAT